MADIGFKVSEVQSVISELAETEKSLNDKIKEINDKKGTLSAFWSAKEATNFLIQLQMVQSNLSKFMNKYQGYLSFLNSVVDAYGKDAESFAATIGSIAAKHSSSS